MQRPLRIGIHTSRTGLRWGGSEELWCGSAAALLARGHDVRVNVPARRDPAPRLRELEAKGARITWRRSRALYGRTVRRALLSVGADAWPHLGWLRRERLDFVLVNAGDHLQELSITGACRTCGIPYAILLQAVGSPHWIQAADLDSTRRAYAGAERIYLVSPENQALLEANLGLRLEHAEIVDNPIRSDITGPIPWAQEQTLRIACVARLHLASKGQDVIARVLQAPRWRERDLTVHLFGEDQGSERQLRDLIRLCGLEKKLFIEGAVDDVAALWRRHHALLLPSRYEGSSLSLLEAMRAGRVPIVTEVGRAGELVEDGVSGFLAAAPTPRLVDGALERAWQRRTDWEAIGRRAATRLAELQSADPIGDFANTLEEAAGQSR